MGGVARGSSANLLGALVMATCTFALTVAITRGLSRDAAGVFFAGTSLFVLATTVGQLGTNTGLVYFISRLRSLGRVSEIETYYRTAIGPVLVIGIMMSVAMIVFAHPLAALVAPGHADETASYLRVLALFIPLAGWENVTLAATRGLGIMRPNVVVEQLFRPVLQLALVGVVLLVARSADGLAWTWAGPYLPAAVAAILWWRHLSRGVIARAAGNAHAGHKGEEPVTMGSAQPTQTVAPGREFWRFTAPRALASVGQTAMQRLDIVLVAALAGVAQAAVYTAATRFLVVGQMGNRAISLAVQPRLGGALARNAVAETNHYYRVSTAWLMSITWPLYLTFIVFGGVLLRVFGESYISGEGVLLLLAATMLLATGCGMVDMVLNMAGRTAWNLYNVLLSVGVQFALLVLLIPRLGILGAAIGWAAAIALSNLVALSQVGFRLGLHPFGRAPLIAGSLAVVCFAGIGFVTRLFLGLSIPALAVSLAIGLPLYAVGLWFFRGPLELRALRDIRSSGRRHRRQAAVIVSERTEGVPDTGGGPGADDHPDHPVDEVIGRRDAMGPAER